MENFTFCSPTNFIFGKNTENEAGRVLLDQKVKKVLIHYGGGSVVRSGLLSRVENSLKEAKIDFVLLGGARPNPLDDLVYEGIRLAKEENVDFILALGGGSAIDSAKAICVGAEYEGDFWDFYSGKEDAKSALPMGTILTIAAAGSEGSDSSVITKKEGMLKRGYSSELIRPRFSILNPELTQTLPPNQTSAGVADIMAHIFERYFSLTTCVEVTDRLAESLLLTLLKEVPKVMIDPNDYQARANIMWVGMLAHNNLVGVGRKQDWSSHNIEHELSALYDIAHGDGLAVVFPAWLKYTLAKSGQTMRFAQFAVRVFQCDMDYFDPMHTALEGIKKLEEFWKSIGLPIRLAELGAKKEDVPYLIKNMGLGDKDKIGQFYPLGNEDIKKIYDLMSAT